MANPQHRTAVNTMNIVRTAKPASQLVKLLDEENLNSLLAWLDDGGARLLWEGEWVSQSLRTARDGYMVPGKFAAAPYHHFLASDDDPLAALGACTVAVLELAGDEPEWADTFVAELVEQAEDKPESVAVWTLGGEDDVRAAVAAELASRSQNN